ncbi:unnamed protein product [Ilex paraguariensis]|uniref:Uncharacterized protein n=1 Tax=Ilex paraguariensis TaxID=185542 RepID=A0ABC8U6J9_9AQUA
MPCKRRGGTKLLPGALGTEGADAEDVGETLGARADAINKLGDAVVSYVSGQLGDAHGVGGDASGPFGYARGYNACRGIGPSTFTTSVEVLGDAMVVWAMQATPSCSYQWVMPLRGAVRDAFGGGTVERLKALGAGAWPMPRTRSGRRQEGLELAQGLLLALLLLG